MSDVARRIGIAEIRPVEDLGPFWLGIRGRHVRRLGDRKSRWWLLLAEPVEYVGEPHTPRRATRRAAA